MGPVSNAAGAGEVAHIDLDGFQPLILPGRGVFLKRFIRVEPAGGVDLGMVGVHWGGPTR